MRFSTAALNSINRATGASLGLRQAGWVRTYAGYGGSRDRDGYSRDRDGYGRNRNDSRGGFNDFRSSRDSYRGGRDNSRGGFNDRGRGRNSGRGGGMKSRRDPRNEKEEDELLGRTLRSAYSDDGLMGQPSYEIDREALATLKWTDLRHSSSEQGKGGEDAEGARPSGTSDVATVTLAERRLLSRPLVNSLVHNRKYEWLTPVQAQTLLPILRGESVVVRAKTGTGKTAAFAIPILQKVLEAKLQAELESRFDDNKVSALIVSPTRELAQQIADEVYKITQFGGLSHLTVQSLVGGVDKYKQMKAAGLLSGPRAKRPADIIVATPGRLRDVLDDPEVAKRFTQLTARVFDEADRILDIGFEREMEQIKDLIDDATRAETPDAAVPEVPLLLFSATADRTMRDFARRQFGDRVRVVDTVPKNEPTANELVEQHAVSSPNWADLYVAATKQVVDIWTAAQETGGSFKAVVFLPTTAMVDHYERLLSSTIRNLERSSGTTKGRGAALPVLGIHGQRSQQSRQTRADRFRRAQNAVLVTTDVVARGMDFPSVTHVFQLGPPADVASYVHRIGRTARIGNSGKSYMYYTQHMRGYIDALARENIRPALELAAPDAEAREALQPAFVDAAGGNEESSNELVSSLMSYMSVLKAKFRIPPQEFVRDMDPLTEMLELPRLNLRGSQRDTWLGGRSSSNRGRGGRNPFGSSRKNRMRW